MHGTHLPEHKEGELEPPPIATEPQEPPPIPPLISLAALMDVLPEGDEISLNLPPQPLGQFKSKKLTIANFLLQSLVLNWRTTLAGAITIGLGIAEHRGAISAGDAILYATLAAGAGLITAKDQATK
jgi:hypothetical protein